MTQKELLKRQLQATYPLLEDKDLEQLVSKKENQPLDTIKEAAEELLIEKLIDRNFEEYEAVFKALA